MDEKPAEYRLLRQQVVGAVRAGERPELIVTRLCPPKPVRVPRVIRQWCGTCSKDTDHRDGVCTHHETKYCDRCTRQTLHKGGNCTEYHAYHGARW